MILRVENLKKTYNGNEILKGVNFEVNEGEIISIIGSSGAGKSTLLRCINQLEEADSGAIYYNDINILDKSTNINDIRKEIGMVFQQFNLFNNMNVIKNCIIGLRHILKIKKEEAIKIAMEELEKVGMAGFENAKVSTLSGGQKQRVAIARTLAMKPKIILFDEPTSALDPEMVREVLDVIKKLTNENITMLIVTHEMEFARNISDKIIFLDDGNILDINTPENIFNSKIERIKTFINSI